MHGTRYRCVRVEAQEDFAVYTVGKRWMWVRERMAVVVEEGINFSLRPKSSPRLPSRARFSSVPTS